MTFGRTLNNALKQKGITTKFGGSDVWCATAQDRQRWLELTNPKSPPRPRPPRANPPNVATTAPPPPPPPAPPPDTTPVPANGPRHSARLHGNTAENAAAQQIGDNSSIGLFQYLSLCLLFEEEDLFYFYVSFVWRFAFHFEGAYFRQFRGSSFGGLKSGRRGLLTRAKRPFPVGPW
jgi:hypothetical protein